MVEMMAIESVKRDKCLNKDGLVDLVSLVVKRVTPPPAGLGEIE